MKFSVNLVWTVPPSACYVQVFWQKPLASHIKTAGDSACLIGQMFKFGQVAWNVPQSLYDRVNRSGHCGFGRNMDDSGQVTFRTSRNAQSILITWR